VHTDLTIAPRGEAETAMVLGANGQDGTFLVRRLLRDGRHVVGVDLAERPRFAQMGAAYHYVPLDLRDHAALTALLHHVRPARIYHVAAVHLSSAGGTYEPLFDSLLAVNVGSAHAALEYLRTDAPDCRLLYASSGKVFGSPFPEQIDEGTPRTSTCPYSITKNAAGDLLLYYRKHHDVSASILYLFNHESELRPPDFFIPKLVAAVRQAISPAAPSPRARFHSLDFYCDWGDAEEYMDIAVDVLERAPGEDFVLGTGHCAHAREVVEQLFGRHGLRASDHVEENEPQSTTASRPYHVDSGKLARLVGRRPEIRLDAFLARLVDLALGGQ
jgi:GDPmannose 4,6-dehydratase